MPYTITSRSGSVSSRDTLTDDALSTRASSDKSASSHSSFRSTLSQAGQRVIGARTAASREERSPVNAGTQLRKAEEHAAAAEQAVAEARKMLKKAKAETALMLDMATINVGAYSLTARAAQQLLTQASRAVEKKEAPAIKACQDALFKEIRPATVAGEPSVAAVLMTAVKSLGYVLTLEQNLDKNLEILAAKEGKVAVAAKAATPVEGTHAFAYFYAGKGEEASRAYSASITRG